MAAKNNVYRLGEETEFRRFRLYSVLEGEKNSKTNDITCMAANCN